MNKDDAKKDYKAAMDVEAPQPSGGFLHVGAVKVIARPASPWLEIETPEGAIAIWKRTGAVHPVTECGAVTDEPLDLPFPNEGPDVHWSGLPTPGSPDWPDMVRDDDEAGEA